MDKGFFRLLDITPKVKDAILESSEEKVFGCIHCKEDSERVITDLSIMVDDIVKATKLNILVLEDYNKDGSSEWGISFTNPNPEAKDYFPMSKETAFRLKDYLSS